MKCADDPTRMDVPGTEMPGTDAPGTDERGTDALEQGFVDQIAAHYAPRPWSSEQRARFDAALRARIERAAQRRPALRGWLVPALAAVAAAALVWFRFSTAPEQDEPDPLAASGWESELFLSSDVSTFEDLDDSEALPDDYVAIASLFLDG